MSRSSTKENEKQFLNPTDSLMLQWFRGAISCMLPVPILNPIEVKTRLQLQGELNGAAKKHYYGLFRSAITIFKEEKISGLYKGFGASVLREGIYAGLRLGLYESLKSLLGEDPNRPGELPYYKKVIAGSCAGGIGAFLANPTDVVKVRLQAERNVQNPRYSGSFNAFYRILKEEGLIKGWYKGVIPTTQRAMIISAAMMPTYENTKRFLLRYRILKSDGVLAHVSGGLAAGFAMAAVTSPIDVLKTRLMNQQGNKYKGLIDCFFKSVQAEGLLSLYKGFFPSFARLGPHTIMAMSILEQLRKFSGVRPV